MVADEKITQRRTARRVTRRIPLLLAAGVMLAAGCSSGPTATSGAPAASVAAAAAPQDFPSPEKFGGFDARRAYTHMATTVAYGPRTVGSEANRKSQEYIKAQLASYGCAVEEDSFEASTPIGRLRMKNIVGKVAGEKSDVILLLSHYDTKNMPETPNFVGANDPGTSLGSVLELARIICARKNKVTYWFGFVDGEEAFGEWSDINSTFGSRQMAAKLALSGELKKIKAVVLLDLIGHVPLGIPRDSNSTPWLVDIVWQTAKRLGYEKHFLASELAASDDHLPFLRRKVAAVDLIDLSYAHWHTAEDTPDKISPQSLAIVGHVVLESLPAIENHK